MNTEQRNSQYPTYIYPPPLLDSLSLLLSLKITDSPLWEEIANTCRNMLKEIPHKRPIYSLPCLVGESLEDILKFADLLCWGDGEYYRFSKRFQLESPYELRKKDAPAHQYFLYNDQENLYETRRFCPVVIYRPDHKKIDDSFSMILCAYTLIIDAQDLSLLSQPNDPFTQAGALLSQKKISALHIENISFRKVLSLKEKDLTPVADWLDIQELYLRTYLKKQAYRLYGIVPSFMYSVDGKSSSKKLDRLNFSGEGVTVSVHPNTVNWWTVAQNYQYSYLCKAKDNAGHPIKFPFPNQHFMPDENGDFEETYEFYVHNSQCEFALYWQSKLVGRLTASIKNVDDLVLRYFSPVQEDSTSKGVWNPDAGSLAPFGTGKKYQSISNGLTNFDDYEWAIPPIDFPISLLRQNREQHELLSVPRHNACSRWLSYACQNSSCAFFVGALLYAAYAPFYPIKTAESAVGIQVFQCIKKKLPLLIDDVQTLEQNPDHPLCNSSNLWHTHHVSARTSVSSAASAVKKIHNKLIILIFDGPTRQLSENDYNLLMCAAPMLIIGNAHLPDGYAAVHICVKDLGLPSAGDTQHSAFPSREAFGHLKIIGDHTLARLMWYAAKDKLFRANLRTHTDDSEESSTNQMPHLQFLRKMSHNTLQQRQTLLPFKELVLADCKTPARASKKTPYLPFLLSLSMLDCAQYFMHDTAPVNQLSFSSPRPGMIFSAECFTYVTPAMPVSAPTKKSLEQLWKTAYPDFLRMLKGIRIKGAPAYGHSKEEYLQEKEKGNYVIGWESDGIMYLDYTQYWDTFCAIYSKYRPLTKKKLYFLKNILAPAAGSYLHRDDAKSGHWACRYTVFKDGKRQRIGSFLVLDSAILTDSANDRCPQQN